MNDAIFAFVGMALGGVLVGTGVWLGYRFGYEAKTGVVPSAGLTEPEYGGAVLDYAEYPDSDDS